ncbi:DMT family transporter [Desulfonatronum thioautotrophicum]|uniref:DMT family transporter n=1 Tax=Desulfonatronum thioautotrophicum TaxID=617001 RepID=UPI000699E20D|nr:DMT family transporter [Desulfonatronum thioautotrophicum]
MEVWWALLAAALFGAADFSAGIASRRSPALTVTFLSQSTGMVLFGLSLVVLLEQPTGPALRWGAIAGAIAAVSVFLYYRALALGRMGIVATITAIWSAVVPFGLGLALGERPSILAICGVVGVIFAVGMISYIPTPTARPRTLPASPARQKAFNMEGGVRFNRILPRHGFLLRFSQTPGMFGATLAGIGFGLLGVLLNQAGALGNVLWPVFSAAVASVLVTGIMLAGSRSPLLFDRGNLPHIISAGVMQSLGVLCFLLAIQTGLVSIVAVIVALSPAPTLLLARMFLAETLSRNQLLGFVVAMLGIALVTV